MTSETTMSGDPLRRYHHHPSSAVQDKVEADGEDQRYASDSDDDDDVDRYVFLARQPAPKKTDGGEGATPKRGGGGGRKRRLREILLADDTDTPAAGAMEARLDMAAPRGASAEEAADVSACSPERGRGGLDLAKKKKKRRHRSGEPQVRGKNSSGGSHSQHRDVTAEGKTPVEAAVAVAAAAAPKRFLCSICGRSFGSHHALGGHMHFGHRKKGQNTIAVAAAHADVAGGGNGDRDVVKVDTASQEDADGNADDSEDKASVGKRNVGFAAHHQDADGNINEEMFAGTAYHGDRGGDGIVEEKAAVRRSHELAIGNANRNNKERKTQYRCEVCDKVCLSGQALGGHMRKHSKRPPHDGGKERRSPEVDGMPNQRAVVEERPAQ